MSRILKRPMFRIGGQANEEGIVSMATPRKNYQAGGYDMEAIEKIKKHIDKLQVQVLIQEIVLMIY